ncbi:3-hydroxy-3-methylglutaryl-ACP synthase [Massilia sp. PAMC28688]|uniref:hydroxymethylglutaryl-CoA synthase family protein n=1 Tax=Massilia sp. PAMC28688 TaxID=2861283 RepID=UPI001C62740C|nr:hydroxymethylglutaryl-CoA synthase [Massilia sp. PAMC28688]QYF93471.1 3-hydroxy-3-methylglutaryl-ACP synthase [Massilia sp. PAMC28688]
MSVVGFEAINAYAGAAFLDVEKLAIHRELDTSRFENLLMRQKTVALPYEDPVTYGMNAAMPIVAALSPEEKDRIEMIITCTESAFDFGKSMSSYFHSLLGLNKNCRTFEIKSACYSGAAGVQMAINFILSSVSPGAKVLVIATDISRFMVAPGGSALSSDWSFLEPSSGAGAVAMLVSDTPTVFQFDVGANGYYGYEVMDTCRPAADVEAGNADVSLLSYLDCCEKSYLEYEKRVTGADFRTSFRYLAMHTPFGGMVKGAHRNIMRKLAKAAPPEIEADFENRVMPGIRYCQRVGNIMGATAMLSLVSVIQHGQFDTPQRVGIFSYGSGCCSEFFSGVASRQGQQRVRDMGIGQHLDSRYELSMPEYESILEVSNEMRFGTRNVVPDAGFIAAARSTHGKKTLFLKEIKEFHREYEWI